MIVLSLDTTGPQVSVSITDGTCVVAHEHAPMIRGHAEALGPMTESLFAQTSISPHDIDKVAVCTGPGSFTGLRVGLSFAKGFALPRKTPVIGLPSLAIWAAQVDPEAVRDIICVSDVRRGELCWAAYFKGEMIRAPLTEPAEQARAAIGELRADEIIEDACVDTRVLGRIAQSLSSKDHPALPLYARGADAKLPSPKIPKIQHRTKRA